MKSNTLEPVRLTPRLAAIAKQVQKGARLSDIGTDHAHLPISLIQNEQISYAIASDVREGPLACARENAVRYGCMDKISLRLGAGLEKVKPEECDTISIAGMGGETISQILQDAEWTAQGKHTLLLQPMTMVAELRQWLWKNGFEIEKEIACCEESRRYVVICARGGNEPKNVPLNACYISPALLRADGAADYVNHVLRREKRVLDGLRHAISIDPDRIHEQERKVQMLEKGLEELI